jgi:hypothetical protein
MHDATDPPPSLFLFTKPNPLKSRKPNSMSAKHPIKSGHGLS